MTRFLIAALTLLTAARLQAQEDLRVTTDRTVDTRSLESIVADVVRFAGARTNDEKAIAIHDWLHHTIFHCAYPTEKSPQSVGPLKVLNVYGWGLCGGQHTVLKSLFETAGWKVRYRGWSNPGHTTIEVQYDGRWHYFDTFLKCYFWMKDRKTIAGQDDIVKDPSIVLDALKEGRAPRNHFLCCGDTAEGVVQGCRNSKPYPVSEPKNGWASVTGRDRGYSPSLSLPAGSTLRLEWKNIAGKVAVKSRNRHSCGTKDFRSDPVLGPVLEHYGARTFANGRFTYAPDFNRKADAVDVDLRGAAPRKGKLVATSGRGQAIFNLKLPYVYVDGTIEAAFEEGEGKLSLSTDGGKTWKAVEAGDVSGALWQKYDVRIKAEFGGSLGKFRLESTVQHNRSALPHLLPGDNAVTVSAEKKARLKDRTVKVTYAYREATVKNPESRKRWDGRGVSYGGEKKNSRGVTSLPATYTIKVRGNTPPKMLYLEMAVTGR